MRRTAEDEEARSSLALALGLAAALGLTALLPAAAPAAKTTVFINGDSISNYRLAPADGGDPAQAGGAVDLGQQRAPRR